MKQELRAIGISDSAEKAIKLFGMKWTLLILRKIFAREGNVRYNELLKSIKGINPKILSKRLKQLEDFGIIKREVFLEVPVKVEYSFTESGEDLTELFAAIDGWSSRWVRN
jgi:DNA-binding HxlR family transcriptional regulator